MPTQCGNLARGKMVRFTRLDECGAIDPGPLSTLVTKSLVSVTWTPNYLEAEEISQADANGDLCVDDRSDPALRWIDLEAIICVIDPDMINLITGDPVVVDDAVAPNTVGFRIDAGAECLSTAQRAGIRQPLCRRERPSPDARTERRD